MDLEPNNTTHLHPHSGTILKKNLVWEACNLSELRWTYTCSSYTLCLIGEQPENHLGGLIRLDVLASHGVDGLSPYSYAPVLRDTISMVYRDGIRHVHRYIEPDTRVLMLFMDAAPPYLLSLGLPRDLMSLVLLAAPLSGLVVQPLIGHYADHSTSKYGRRRPFMFFGSLIAGLSMFTLGYGKPLMEGLFGADSSLVRRNNTIRLFVCTSLPNTPSRHLLSP